MRKAFILFLAVGLITAIMACPAGAVTGQLEENWDGYTSGDTPYGPNNGQDWELKNGDWMGLTEGPALSGTQSYSIGDSQTSEIKYSIDLNGAFNPVVDHIVVQGWLYDSGNYSNTWLGLANDTAPNNSLVRIGSNYSDNYQVQYGEFFAGSGIQTVDTGLPFEAGWHYARLDIVNLNYLGIWQADWLIDNADRSVRNTGSFTWFFDRANANKVVLGSSQPTVGPVAWDDIKVGSLEFVGPALPVPEPGGLLALGTALIGLVGLAWRRRA